MQAGRKRHQCICRVLILTTFFCLIPSVSRTETASTFQQGVEYAKLRLYPQAVDTFKSILSRQPTNTDALFQLANVYKLQDELELAIKTFNALLAQLESQNLLSNKAQLESQNFLSNEAQLESQNFLSNKAQLESQNFLSNKAQLESQNFLSNKAQLESQNPLSNTKTADSEDAPANERLYGLTHLALSEIYCKQSKLDIAEQHAKEAVQRCPTDADTHYRLGYIYTHQAKFHEARTAFKHTLARNPDFAEVYEWLGLIALMQRKPRQAVAHYQTAIQKKPYVQSPYYNLAKAYRLIGNMAAATEQLKLFEQMKIYYDRTYAIESALTEDPTNTTLRLKLAEIHLAHKHIAAAIATYQALIRLNPTFITGYDKLARLYMNLNMPEHAIPLFQKVLELNPDAVEAHVRLGWLYTVIKAFDKAEAHLQTAIEKMPQLTLAYHGLAEIYTQQEQFQKAIDVYRRITQIQPDDADAWKALQNLERLKTR